MVGVRRLGTMTDARRARQDGHRRLRGEQRVLGAVPLGPVSTNPAVTGASMLGTSSTRRGSPVATFRIGRSPGGASVTRRDEQTGKDDVSKELGARAGLALGNIVSLWAGLGPSQRRS